jgi:hypothetical protein
MIRVFFYKYFFFFHHLSPIYHTMPIFDIKWMAGPLCVTHFVFLVGSTFQLPYFIALEKSPPPGVLLLRHTTSVLWYPAGITLPGITGVSEKSSARLLCGITTSDGGGGAFLVWIPPLSCNLRGPYLGTSHPQALYTKPFRKRVSA